MDYKHTPVGGLPHHIIPPIAYYPHAKKKAIGIRAVTIRPVQYKIPPIAYYPRSPSKMTLTIIPRAVMAPPTTVVPRAVAIPMADEKKRSYEIREIKNFVEIDDLIRHNNQGVYELGLSVAETEKIIFPFSVMVCDIDFTVIMHTGDHQEYVRSLGKDPKLRGIVKTVEGISWTQCEPLNISLLLELQRKGMTIVFVTDRTEETYSVTIEQLKAFGFPNPVVVCTAGKAKGPVVRKLLPKLTSGKLYVLDDEDMHLKSFIGPEAFEDDRVVLMKYLPYRA
ncbi:MAG: hypothetical protein Edafosvirus11_12 [Edafosvirus sp.]|uniref:Uncharacterized protein n=1 Tax=Edafosvirus sp. TaxID=2487765 RepID=A0A3G4ZU12_9VIRU|nr:MAG: hypothetical protein Edafosvirus11_12 [Edafosvirus sp.]